jgi:hypothetical protein
MSINLQQLLGVVSAARGCKQAYFPLLLHFFLAEAVSQILGTKEKIIKSGSTLKLHCILKRATEKPLYIFW